MRKRTINQLDTINTRETLALFIEDLHRDLQDDPNSWENNNLRAFLQALAAFTRDKDGFYLNRGMPVPETPEWKTFAHMLVAATMYE